MMNTSFSLTAGHGDSSIAFFRMTILALFTVVVAAFSGVASAEPKTEANIIDTPMIEAPSRFFDKIYLAEGVNLQAYRKIYVEPGTVSFSDYWEREHRTDVSNAYKSRVREKYGEALQEQLKKAYSESGKYEVVDDRNQADIILKPVLENLNIFGPENDFQLTRTFVYRAGNATFNLLMVDAKTGDAVAKFVDNRDTRESPGLVLERADRITNYRDFRQLMRKWSREVVEYAEEEKA